MWLGRWLHGLAVNLGGCDVPPKFEIVEQESFMPNPEVSDFPVYGESWGDTRKSLEDLGMFPMTEDMPDKMFYYTDLSVWEQILISLTFSGDIFAEEERRDCDDYSKLASAVSGFVYGLNCVQAWGESPYGYHAYNMVKIPDGEGSAWRVFEPNAGFEVAGELFEFKNTYGWNAQKWKP
tara:strand:+ start:3638 stop:4174 length:537 start_codon:yes stop_codon:yes gene_type:complete